MHGLMPNLARRRGRRKLEHIFDPAIGRWEIKLGGHRAYTFDLLQLMYKDLRDLPIQERKAKPKDLFGGYIGSARKTPDLLCLEESFPEWLHTKHFVEANSKNLFCFLKSELIPSGDKRIVYTRGL
jgi:hypothetical protein